MLAPGWTSYHHRLRYQTYDVTDLLRDGPQRHRRDRSATAGTAGGSGFGGGRRNIYGDRLALLAQLEIRYADGTTERVVTDDELARRDAGRSCASGIYDGETYDARLERPAGRRPATTTATGAGVRPLDRDLGTLVAPDRAAGAPHRAASRRSRSPRSPSGRTIVDFGQNLVGRLRLTRARRPAGTTITLRHAEVLEHGELGTRPLRSAAATDRYTLRGGGVGDLGAALHLPRLPLRRGRRLARRARRRRHRGPWSATPTWSAPAGSSARTRCSTGCTRTSSGACAATSSTCRPTARSATSGWAGPATSRSSRPPPAFLYDCAGLPALLAGRPGRRAAGRRAASCPSSCPTSCGEPPLPGRGLGRRRGDRAVGALRALRRPRHAGRQFDEHARLGRPSPRWPARPPVGQRLPVRRLARPGRPAGPPGAGAHRPGPGGHRLLRPLGRAGRRRPPRVLGRRRGRSALPRAWPPRCAPRSPPSTSRPPAGCSATPPTAYALALEFDLLPDADAAPARRRRGWPSWCATSGYHISTGFVGTPLICDALCSVGRRTTPPTACSAARVPVLALPGDDGRHDDLGALGQHAARRLDQPRRDDLVQPLRARRGGRLAAPHRRRPGARRARLSPAGDHAAARAAASPHARARHRTPYGLAECAWAIEERADHVEVVVPPNTTASVTLPGNDAEPIEVGSGTHRWSYPYAAAIPSDE